ENRQKRNTAKLLDIHNKKPVLHTSSMFSTDYFCTALIVPLIQDPINSNAVVCYDLRYNPDDLLSLPADEIRKRLYTKTQDLPEGQQRLAIKSIHLNKCPVIVPAKIDAYVEQRLSIDKIASHQHLEQLRNAKDLENKLIDVFSKNKFSDNDDLEPDPDQSLYGGPFFSDRDKKLMQEVHKTDLLSLANKSFDFADNRLDEMLFRFRARNYPELLTNDETIRWNEYRLDRLTNENNPWMTVLKYKNRINELKQDGALTEDKITMLNELLEYETTLLDLSIKS
ncbi:MAG: exodeoxyribonuclease I, partial [Gammaproteobacteria bacterium]|nr:exodeoxyribonuclease I [Gammaproteobacteria bacterium]